MSVSSSFAMHGGIFRYAGPIEAELIDNRPSIMDQWLLNEKLLGAVRRNDVPLFRTILESPHITVDIDVSDKEGWTPLLLAAAGRPIEMLQLILTKRVDLKARTKGNGYTALHWAAEQGNNEAVIALILAGADVQARDEFGETALYKAVKKNELAKVAVLLAAQAAVNEVNKNVETPLFYAKDPLIAQELIEAGADVGITTEYGQTALHHVVQEGRVKVVTVLLSANAERKRKGTLWRHAFTPCGSNWTKRDSHCTSCGRGRCEQCGL